MIAGAMVEYMSWKSEVWRGQGSGGRMALGWFELVNQPSEFDVCRCSRDMFGSQFNCKKPSYEREKERMRAVSKLRECAKAIDPAACVLSCLMVNPETGRLGEGAWSPCEAGREMGQGCLSTLASQSLLPLQHLPREG